MPGDDYRPPPIHRTISHALAAARQREESETLLGEEDALVDQSGCLVPQGLIHNPHAELPVYKNIHR